MESNIEKGEELVEQLEKWLKRNTEFSSSMLEVCLGSLGIKINERLKPIRQAEIEKLKDELRADGVAI